MVAVSPRVVQDFKKCETIVNGAMSFMKIACLSDEVTEFGTLEATEAPIDLLDRTGPGLVDEQGRERFTEGAIEPGIVGNDEVRGFNDAAQGRDVDLLIRHHFVGNPCQPGDISRDRR